MATMSLEDLSQRANIPTLPLDELDPFRFAQLTETAKDCFQRELYDFFSYRVPQFQTRKIEVPTLEKYNLGFNANDTAIETFTRIILQHPDVLERLPLVAITTATGSNLKLGLGTHLVASVNPAARVKSTKVGPYALVEDDRIAFATYPNGSKDPVISYVTFVSLMIPDLAHATADEVVAVAKAQLLYVTAAKTLYSKPVGVIRFDAIGPFSPDPYPNSIEVLGPPHSTQNALDVLGFMAGQKDTASDHNPANRYQLAMNLTVGLDIGAESENERRELTDLLTYFFSLEMDKRKFVFYGRSVFDDEVPNEWYQVILKDQHSLSGESEIPRQSASGEQRDLIYINRLQVPITIVDYVDRELTVPPRRSDELVLIQARNALPPGDYQTIHTAGEVSG